MTATPLTRRALFGVATAAVALAASACGAGSQTGEQAAKAVACDFAKPASAVTVNLLAYNSSAIDPYTNTMVKSCSKDGVTVRHEPIDFGGQEQKKAVTLAGAKGTYDIIEVYGSEIPYYASQDAYSPLDELWAKNAEKYGLGDLDETMVAALKYDGKQQALPMQANVVTMVYRKDVFDELGLQPPATFADLASAGKAIQDAGKMKYPIALPASDSTTLYEQTMISQGFAYLDDAGEATFETPEAKAGLQALVDLRPYMDPQVTAFDQPKVQQQLYTGKAAVAMMFSGRMADVVDPNNSPNADKFAFAAPPAIAEGGKSGSVVSVDGWAIPKNSAVDKELLFALMASSVSVDASEASLPFAYPARTGIVTEAKVPYAKAVQDALDNGATVLPLEPWVGPIETAVYAILINAIKGDLDVDAALAQSQKAATAAVAKL